MTVNAITQMGKVGKIHELRQLWAAVSALTAGKRCGKKGTKWVRAREENRGAKGRKKGGREIQTVEPVTKNRKW